MSVIERLPCHDVMIITERKYMYKLNLGYVTVKFGGPGSVVGIATGYGLDGPGIEFRGGGASGRDFRTCPDRPWGPPSLLYNGYRLFPGGKERQGRDADPSPPSNAIMKE
jgi:hypothetical protein